MILVRFTRLPRKPRVINLKIRFHNVLKVHFRLKMWYQSILKVYFRSAARFHKSVKVSCRGVARFHKSVKVYFRPERGFQLFNQYSKEKQISYQY